MKFTLLDCAFIFVYTKDCSTLAHDLLIDGPTRGGEEERDCSTIVSARFDRKSKRLENGKIRQRGLG